MAHFLIYLPGKQTADPQYLVDAGLSDLAEGHSMTPIKGPDGKGGMLVCWDKRFEWEAGWNWKPAVPYDELEAGRYWYGLKEGSPPTPRELQRNYPHAGAKMLLGDQHEWIIPRAQELASVMQLADDGSLRFVVQRQFHAFHLESQEWEKKIRAQQENTRYTYEDIALFVMQAIQLNYRFTREVISELQLFTKDNLGQCMLEICGLTYGQ